VNEERNLFEPTYSTFTEGLGKWLRQISSAVYLTLPVMIPACICLAIVNIFVKVVPKPYDALGNLLILSGVTFVASGVVLNRQARHLLLTVRNQEAVSKTQFVRKTDVLKIMRRLLMHLKRGARPDAILKAYYRTLRRLHTPGDFRFVITQNFLSRLLIDSSDRAEIGTLLMVVGTITVMVASRLEK
jgi:hypothetical protein